MHDAVIIDAVRTPVGRHGGALAAVRPDDMAALVIRELVRRTGVDPALVEEVYLGCANQAGEDNRNVARMATLLAGLPQDVAAVTFNRLCASGLNAINQAARAIKAIDPAALVFGPSNWGATEMVDFQNAPDWASHARYGSFLALYLDAFRKASEQDGKRLLDTLDVHWYPFSNRGSLFRTDAESLDSARLDAPRSLDESGFREDSWVARALQRGGEDRPVLPILPSLHRIIARRFPGTKLSVSEFNYGLGKRVPSALALADALGRYATNGVFLAAHWGSLDNLLSESYRLYRTPDVLGGAFAGRSVPVQHQAAAALAAFAADDGVALRIVLINRTSREIAADLDVRRRQFRQAHGFEDGQPTFGKRMEAPDQHEGGVRLVLPPLSARRYLFV